MEIQKTITFAPKYAVSNLGNIKNLKTNRLLKGDTHENGYKRVQLMTDEGRKHYRVHRLVALMFIPNPENKPQVDHLNGIRQDNRLENLRWVNNKENMQNEITKSKIKNSKLHRDTISYKEHVAVVEKLQQEIVDLKLKLSKLYIL